MRSLNVEQLQSIEGGAVDCGTGWGLVVGLTVGFTLVAIATGGAALPVLIAAEAAIVGSPVAGINCLAN